MNDGFFRECLDIVISVLIVGGIFYGCSSWYRHCDKVQLKEKELQDLKLPEAYRGFQNEFYNDILKFETESADSFLCYPPEILLKQNWRCFWLNWQDEKNKMMVNGYNIITRYTVRLHSVVNPPEIEFLANSLLVDDFAWKVECCEKLFEKANELLSIYDKNSSKWSVIDREIVYFDEPFRKNVKVLELKYIQMYERLCRSQEDD